MEIQEITREQLILKLDDLERQLRDLKEKEENLRESEERYRALYDIAPVGITVTDFHGGMGASNKAIQELLGYTPKDLKTINVLNFYVDPTERQRLLDLTERSGVVRDFETKFKRKDGKVITVLMNTDLIDFGGQHKVLLTSIRDITNLKQIEAQLTKERDFTNAILDTAASLVLVLDQDGLITRFNRACEKATGYSFQEMKGKHIWDTLSVNPVLTREKIETLLAGNYPSTHENLWFAKNGEQRLISWSNTVLLDNENKVEYIIATGIDITERRQAEKGLQEANQKLATWVSELEERSAEMNQLSEMGEQLQSCQNIEEACAISVLFIKKLFPTDKGALYLISPSKDLAEAVEMWGDSTSTEKIFMPLNCWAIRRGRPHLVDDSHPGLLCGHITGSQAGQCLCVPMMAHGEAMGVLHLNHTEPEQDLHKSRDILFTEHKTQVALALADHLAMAMGNLRLRETLRQQAIRDILTGLFNRRYMEETLKRELNQATREGTTVGVIMFDIDHFKKFNDLHGHDGGDILLRELGAFLNTHTRGGDIVSRYGGEEFVAVLPGATLEDTRLRAEELRQGVKELKVYHLGKPLEKITISLGIAAFPEHGLTNEELLRKADTALYQAKNEGRDRVVVASIIS
jgi:diguanylate cyclase (GGDEF)-like protein/PAS domain S-box-containing protein